MYNDNGVWKPAFRIKRTYSVYSTPTNHRVLAYSTRRKAELALNWKNGQRNSLPEGTKIIEMKGVVDDI